MQHGAALFSGVLYSQGSGAYQSSVRNRSKLVVNSVGKPANMLVNQGVGGIIANFLYKIQTEFQSAGKCARENHKGRGCQLQERSGTDADGEDDTGVEGF